MGAIHHGMGGYRLLYFEKSKNGTKCKNHAIIYVLLCFYVNTFILCIS